MPKVYVNPVPGLLVGSYEDQDFTRELPENLEDLVEDDVDEEEN